MQNIKDATHQLNKPAWPRRRADKLSVALLYVHPLV